MIFERYIPVYLKLLNSDSIFRRKRKEYLFFEGKSDIQFYRDLVSKDNLAKKSFFDVTFQSFIDIDKRLGKKDSEINNNNRIISHNYDIVIKCTNEFCLNKDKYPNINLFGFIDRDFGHEVFDNPYIIVNEFHDNETNLIRNCLPFYFEGLFNAPRALDRLIKTLIFCFKQGVLELASHLYEKDNKDKYEFISFEKATNLKEITRKYFSKENSSFLDFDFDKYVNSIKSTPFFPQTEVGLFKKYYKTTKNKYNYCLESIPNLVKKWISKNQLIEKETETLDLIFKFVNGHIFINQLIYKNELFCFVTQTSLTEYSFKLNFFKGNYSIFEKISTCNPLKDYLNHFN